MKKIWPWLALLLLLIILCVWTKKDTMHLSSDTQSHVTATPMVTDKTHAINYQLVQRDHAYVLSGNFKNVKQQNALSDTFSAAGAILGYKGTTTNNTLIGDEAIELTQSILPHFIANYTDGKIVYENEMLRVSGEVKGYEAKRIMQRLLSRTTIPTQNDTTVIVDKPIDFTIMKDETLHLSGNFSDQQQVQSLTAYLRPSFTATDINTNVHRIDAVGIVLAQKVLPLFVQKYTSGKITYENAALRIEGMVETQEDLDEMNSALLGAKIPVKNLTIIDPEALKRAEQAKEEAEALAKAQEAERLAAIEAEKKAKEEARKDEENKLAAEKAAAQAKTQAQAQAKIEADAAKTKIVKLLQIKNIEFEVAKGTLTPKGEATVDKLANILKEYPHIKIEIAGHTDSDGSAVFNQKLSQDRVDTVKKRLVSKGVPASRLNAKGYGESKPLVPNTTDENKQKNRRVEINILGE